MTVMCNYWPAFEREIVRETQTDRHTDILFRIPRYSHLASPSVLNDFTSTDLAYFDLH